MTVRPIAELVEEVAERLSSEQIHAIAARVAAAELRDPDPPRKTDLATELAFDLDGTVRHLADLWGPNGVGIDTDIVAAWLLPQLVRAGLDELTALAALQRVTGWRPRTDEERWAAVARAMVETDGFPPDIVREAIRTAAAAS